MPPLLRICKALKGSSLWAWNLVVLLLAISLPPSAQAVPDWSPLLERLVADGLDKQAIQTLFSRPEIKFEPGVMSSKLEELLKRPYLDPALTPPWRRKAVYRSFLKHRIIERARAYLQQNRTILENISISYCVPKEIVVSILLVETGLGRNVGSKSAFNNLASMAVCTDLQIIRPYLPTKLVNPGNEDFARACCQRKADWAYSELIALIEYAHKINFDPLGIPGSIYGAIGLCQFMPTNVFSYGVDADKDGRIDLFAREDALHSIANYLHLHGWKCKMDRDSQRRVIFEYNKSSSYVNTVLAVADKLKSKLPSRKRMG